MDIRWGRGNAALAEELGRQLDVRVTSDNFAVRLAARISVDAIAPILETLSRTDPVLIAPAVGEEAVKGLKLSECLPISLAVHVVQERIRDGRGVAEVLGRPTRQVVDSTE